MSFSDCEPELNSTMISVGVSVFKSGPMTNNSLPATHSFCAFLESSGKRREYRSASEKSSCAAGVFPALPGMAGQSQTGRQNQNLLSRWLATPEDDDHRGHAIGSDHQGRYRNIEVLRRVLECQLRAENVKKDAAQGGGVDTDSPRSETQTDEGIRTFTQA